MVGSVHFQCVLSKFVSKLPTEWKPFLQKTLDIQQVVTDFSHGIWMDCEGYALWVLVVVIAAMGYAWLCIYKHGSLIRSIEKAVAVLEQTEATIELQGHTASGPGPSSSATETVKVTREYTSNRTWTCHIHY